MIHALRVPALELGDDLRDASPLFLEWLVDEGQAVSAGQAVCEIEIDKVAIAIESPADGVLRLTKAAADTPVAFGDLLGVVADADEEIDQALKSETPASLEKQPYRPVPQLIQEEAPDLASGPAEPLNAMRSVLARRMTESKLSAPHFYLTTVADMTACAELRKTLKKQKIRATYNDMLIKAAGLTLRQFPRVASLFSPAGYIPRDNMNVGFAVATDPEGLVVPVIRDADKKSLEEIGSETRALIKKAKDRQLTPADYAGGVFSVSNLGGFDVDQFTAIVNPGESAILAIGKIVDTPVAIKGEIAIRPLMKMTLSSDHRTIDGALAARFNGQLKRFLEDPESLV